MKDTREFLAENMVKNAINLYDEKILDSSALYYELNKVGDFLMKKNNTDKYLIIKGKRKMININFLNFKVDLAPPYVIILLTNQTGGNQSWKNYKIC